MHDSFILVLLVMLVVAFFWGIKVYYIVISNAWVPVNGEIAGIRQSVGGDADIWDLTVKYEFNEIVYVKDVLDAGSLDIRKNSVVGKIIPLLVDPSDPAKCVVRNEAYGPFNASASVVAKRISYIKAKLTK